MAGGKLKLPRVEKSVNMSDAKIDESLKKLRTRRDVPAKSPRKMVTRYEDTDSGGFSPRASTWPAASSPVDLAALLPGDDGEEEQWPPAHTPADPELFEKLKREGGVHQVWLIKWHDFQRGVLHAFADGTYKCYKYESMTVQDAGTWQMVRGIYMQLGEAQQVVRGTLQGEASGFKLAVMSPRLAYYTPTFETYQGGTLLVVVAMAARGHNNNSLDPASIPASGLPPVMLQDPLFKRACRSSNIRLHELRYAHDVAVEVAQVKAKREQGMITVNEYSAQIKAVLGVSGCPPKTEAIESALARCRARQQELVQQVMHVLQKLKVPVELRYGGAPPRTKTTQELHREQNLRAFVELESLNNLLSTFAKVQCVLPMCC